MFAWVLSIWACLRISQTLLLNAGIVMIADTVSEDTVGTKEETVNGTGSRGQVKQYLLPPLGHLDQQKLQLEKVSQVVQ